MNLFVYRGQEQLIAIRSLERLPVIPKVGGSLRFDGSPVSGIVERTELRDDSLYIYFAPEKH